MRVIIDSWVMAAMMRREPRKRAATRFAAGLAAKREKKRLCIGCLPSTRRHPQIAADLPVTPHVTPRTLQRWLNAYRTGGLDALTIQKAAGRTPLIPDDLAPEMLSWVKQGPSGCGLDRANWTAAELATSLYQTKGIAVSERTIRVQG